MSFRIRIVQCISSDGPPDYAWAYRDVVLGRIPVAGDYVDYADGFDPIIIERVDLVADGVRAFTVKPKQQNPNAIAHTKDRPATFFFNNLKESPENEMDRAFEILIADGWRRHE